MSKLWRTHTTVILILGLVVLIIATAVAFIVTNFSQRVDVTVGSTVYSARVADDAKERERGLSGVPLMKPNEALLMIYEREDYWGIWMKDMLIAIDIIWINSDGEIVSIVKNASPELSTSKTFTPTEPARYVLEVPGGSTSSNAIKVGDMVSFELMGGEE